MKKLISVGAIALVALSAQFSAHASIEGELANICDVVKTNDKSTLRKKVKKVQDQFKLRLNAYYGTVSCGGQSMLRYAMMNDANEVGTFMVKKLSKKSLGKALGDGKTELQWAEANGYEAHNITSSIKSRLGV